MCVTKAEFRIKNRKLWCAVIGAAVVSPLALTRGALAQYAVTGTSDMVLAQTEYANDNGTDMSANGEFVINESQLAADAGANAGYINIADGSGNWLVQNVPVLAGVPYYSVEVPLGTPDGTNETGHSESLSVDVSASPVTSFTPTAPTSFTVQGEEEDSNEGEDSSAGEGGAFTPGAIAATALNFINSLAPTSYIVTNMPNVQAADNQCAPAAFANAITWLAQNKGLVVPDANNTGRGALPGTLLDPNNPTGGTYGPVVINGAPYQGTILTPNGNNWATQTFFPAPSNNPFVTPLPYGTYNTREVNTGSSLVAQMDLAMGRTSQNRADYFAQDTNSMGKYIVDDTNQGVDGPDQVTGVEKYLGSTRVGDAAYVSIDTQANAATPIGTITNNGITNNTMGTVTANFLYSELSSGEAVKVGYSGHATDLVGTGSVYGVPWMLLQSDLAQTSQNDQTDQILQTYLPFGIGTGISIPQFSFYNQSAQNLPNLGVNVLNAIAISVVPEPGTITLVAGAAVLCSLRRRRRRC